MTRLPALLLLTLLLPLAAAAPIQLEPDSVLLLETQPTLQAGVFDFEIRFQVDADRAGYLKVLPVAGNPIYANGTVDGPGWWTEVRRNQTVLGATNGSQPVDLGLLRQGHHAIVLRVHTPEGAVKEPAELRLKYALAVKGQSSGGSGGNLDPSISLQPILRVQQASQAPDDGGPDEGPGGLRLSVPREGVLIALGIAVLGAVFWVGRRSAKGGGGA